jgi:DNA-binding beta-propeller fold protein YncE
VSADGKRLYVTTADDAVVIDTASRAVLGAVRITLDLADDPQSIAVSQGSNIYVSIPSGNGVKSVTLGTSSPA